MYQTEKQYHGTKESWTTPTLKLWGTVTELTAALGGGGRSDQSEFPQMFPPSTGSFDICINDDPTESC